MTPPDQNDEQPSALSRLERALAGFGEPRADEPAGPVDDDDGADEPAEDEAEDDGAEDAVEEPDAPAPVSPFATDAELENWDPPSSVASSPVLDIASAVEAVERLTASQRSGTYEPAEPADSIREPPVSDADEFVFAATAAGADVEEDVDDEEEAPDAEHYFTPAERRARVKEFADDEVADEDLRVGVDEGSDLADTPDETFAAAEPEPRPVDEPPRVSDAAASWSREQDATQLPYFLVEDNLPVAAEPVLTLEELRQTVPVEEKQRKASVARTLAEIPILLVVAALIAFLVKSFLAQAYYIPSSSMEPQLLVNDRVVVSKLAYKVHDPRRGDIVVFDDPNNTSGDDEEPSLLNKIGEGIGIVQPSTDEFIKRVIALPGETVEGRDGAIYVNGHRLEEPYLPAGPRGVTADFEKKRVKAGHVWVMGDNRTGSADSRVFGAIKIDTIVGRALVTVWPVDQSKFL